MPGHNPLIDLAVMGGLFLIVVAICFIGSKYDARKKTKSALRGATRV